MASLAADRHPKRPRLESRRCQDATEAAAKLLRRMHPEDAAVLESLRAMEVTTTEGRNLSKVLEARHGPGFWEPGLAQGSDQDFLDRLIACGRKYALSIVGGVWKAHIYKEYKLQLAYIHEYFRARAKTVENELQQLHELADLPQEWRDFFDKVQENGQVKITDLAGGPGCCAFGASHFFHELGIRSAVTVLDPVEDWAWCSKELGFEFKVSSTLSDMLLEEAVFMADVVLLGWAVNFAARAFWDRLRVALGTRGRFVPGCNPHALVMVVDRGLDKMLFRDKRARELSKPGVVQRDHGSNVTYSFLVSDDAESEHADAADADDT
ncbi:unnamed protein product [Effrenium voratum]|uniref:Uncharacterized protein n=1 Tax=Effrenium voratum TaxID=2562239 RepID=A0AA36NEE7_9DINO|nr:unnamed protein product [Effrenium voratum]CAJ1441753.1 unnamed protein product [Effrenium voratum]